MIKNTAGKILRASAILSSQAPPNPNRTMEYAAGRLMNTVRITVPIDIKALF